MLAWLPQREHWAALLDALLGLCSLPCAGTAQRSRNGLAVGSQSEHSSIRRLDGRNAAPRTPARAAARPTAAAAGTASRTRLRDAIDATAMQHNIRTACKTTTHRTNARVFVRARASASGRRRRTQTKEPAHAALWLRSSDLHARIVLRVGTFIQGLLPGDRFWGHDATSGERNCRIAETRRKLTSYTCHVRRHGHRFAALVLCARATRC